MNPKKEAKMKMLKELKKMMQNDMYEGMGEGMKKVTVMSDSEKGLEEGLSKAEEILRKRMKMKHEDMEDEEEDEDEYGCGGYKKMK